MEICGEMRERRICPVVVCSIKLQSELNCGRRYDVDGRRAMGLARSGLHPEWAKMVLCKLYFLNNDTTRPKATTFSHWVEALIIRTPSEGKPVGFLLGWTTLPTTSYYCRYEDSNPVPHGSALHRFKILHPYPLGHRSTNGLYSIVVKNPTSHNKINHLHYMGIRPEQQHSCDSTCTLGLETVNLSRSFTLGSACYCVLDRHRQHWAFTS
jgi:hypothetical protein